MPRWGVVAPNRQATPHFNLKLELACKHCGRIPSVEVMQKTAEWLEEVRAALGGHVIHVSSGARCGPHNQAVGGAPNSFHVKGMAADIVVRGMSPKEVQKRCHELQQQGLIGGVGSYAWGTHVDRGPVRRWKG